MAEQEYDYPGVVQPNFSDRPSVKSSMQAPILMK